MVRLMRSKNHTSKTNQFILDFMDWDTFFQAMLNRNEHSNTWNRMAQADCIIGGIDTSISYMCVKICDAVFQHWFMYQYRDNDYGLHDDNLGIYTSNFHMLSRIVYLWPPVQQVNGIGSKQQLIRHLDVIAVKMSSLRPQSKVLKEGDSIPKDAVIKRTHSDCGVHILMPDEAGREWDDLRDDSNVPGSVWIAQAYVPTLRKLGEWKVILIGGRPVYTVHAKYNEGKATWSWEPVDSFYSLEEFRYVWK